MKAMCWDNSDARWSDGLWLSIRMVYGPTKRLTIEGEAGLAKEMKTSHGFERAQVKHKNGVELRFLTFSKTILKTHLKFKLKQVLDETPFKENNL